METKGDKTMMFIRDNMGYIIILIVLGVYIVRGLINIEDTGKSVESILIDSAIAWILGFSISRVLERQGFITGYKDRRYKDTKQLQADKVEEATPFIEKADEYCEQQTDMALKTLRVKILSAAGMSYLTYFDTKGDAIESALKIPKAKKQKKILFIKYMGIDRETEKRNRQKRRALKRALKAEVTPLTLNSMTGKAGVKHDPFNFGMTEKEFARSSAAKDAVYKLVIGVVFGYYGVKMMDDPDKAYLIWAAVQSATFLVGGFSKFLASFVFVVEDARDQLIKRINNLQKFINAYKGGVHNASGK